MKLDLNETWLDVNLAFSLIKPNPLFKSIEYRFL